MAVIASLTGTIKVGDENDPDIIKAISHATGTIAQWLKGRVLVTKASGEITLPQGALTKLQFVWIQLFDETDGTTPMDAVIELNSSAAMVLPSITSLMIEDKTGPTGITAVTVNADASTNNVLADYIFGGAA